MALRRELMSYLGTGAIGGIAGYYARAQGLLGIKSGGSVQTPPDDEEQAPDDEEQAPDDEEQAPDDEEQAPEDSNTDSEVLDDFEDTSELGWDITEGDRSNLTFSEESTRGSHSLFFQDSSTTVKIEKSLGEVDQPQFLSYWFKYQSQNDNNFRVSLFDQNDNKLVELREYNQTVHYKNERTPGVLNNPIADIDQNVWYQVEISNIDFESATLDISVKGVDGEAIGSVTEISFYNEVDSVDYIRIVNALAGSRGQPADPLWIDHIIRR